MGDRQEVQFRFVATTFNYMKFDIQEEDHGITLNCELVGIKNLKTTHNWRLEFDVYEIDSHKVKELMDKLNNSLIMALVQGDE